MEAATTQSVEGRAPGLGRRLRDLGPRVLATRVLRKLSRPWLEAGSVTFFVHDGDGHAESPSQTALGFEIRELSPSDREAILYGSESPWDRLLTRFRAGDLCFGALDPQGRAVHTRWVTLVGTTIPELGLTFVPDADAAYFYDGYTRPDARRHGIDGEVRAKIFEALARRGRRRVYSYVRNDNPAGLRAAGRAQAVAAKARYVRLKGGSPWVFGLTPLRGARLLSPPAVPGTDPDEKGAAWHAWFEGWLKEPLAKRSIGFHQLPEEAFMAMAAHIGETLSLDPSRDHVLDVGCDSALVTRHVSPRCHRLVGVDFIPGMLIDAQRARTATSSAEDHAAVARFAAADGRSLPFPEASFHKAYCTGVVHTLPSVEHAMAMILELIRVVAPGGRILVAALPDLRKRGQARREAFRLGNLGERVRILGAVVVPTWGRRFLRGLRAAGDERPDSSLRYLEFDLKALSATLRSRGVECAVLDYPADFWSRDFRLTRSNLAITVPRPG